ncbi:MAG: alpha/beta hydrolase [Alicyclobacillus sp.]|nr:alpha/beta hydrolase [Alicyclobacillus sp.]
MSIRFDVLYGTRKDREMHVDIYQPTGSLNHRTAVLVLHGGGWRVGDRKLMQSRCEALANRGFSVLAVEYRLLNEIPWPGQLHDVKTAIRWTRAHASELGIDPNRLVLQGHSAGAHLALMAAGTSGRPEFDPDFAGSPPAGPISAVVAYYPIVRLDAGRAMPDLSAGHLEPEALQAIRGADGSFPAAMLLGPAATDEEAASASPINYVTEAFPPTILLHGTADMLVAHAGSLSLFEKLQAAQVPSELHLLSGVNHEFDITPSLTEASATVVASFLKRYVVDPEKFAEEVARTNPLAGRAH